MIFDWRTVTIIAPLTLFVLWIYNKEPETYSQLLRNPRETWTIVAWWKVLLVSVPILVLCLKFLPVLESFLESSLGAMATEPSSTSQAQAGKHISEAVGIKWGLFLSGAIFGIIGGFEELIWRGIALRFLRKKWHWLPGLVISSALFGISHLGEVGFALPMAVYTLIVGLILGGIYLKVGVAGSILVHGGYNFGIFALIAVGL